MTTPPVPQWAVDAIDDVKKHVPVPVEYRYFLARIIAAHAPQGNEEDGESLMADALLMMNGHTKWDVNALPAGFEMAVANVIVRRGIDAAEEYAARKKDL